MHDWAKATARRLGVGGAIDFTTTQIGQTLHVPCAKGNHLVDFTIQPGLNPEGVAKRMLAKGWTIGRKLACPGCKKKKRKESTMENVTPISEARPSPAAGRARRLVYMALEENYDEVKKAYRPGHSDASIAKDCGVAEAVVKNIREESYGPLATPGELETFRESLRKCREEINAGAEAARQGVRALELRFDALCKKNGWME